jgi:UDP-N-acetylmuramoylalanine--D-glutamate ligase
MQLTDLADLAGRDVVLLGVGEETLTVLPHLRAAGVERVRVVEAGDLRPDQSRRLAEQGIEVADLLDVTPTYAEVVLRSPGVQVHRPDVAKLCKNAEVATTPTGLWLAIRGGHRTIVVTGTKGKSSTATLIATGLGYSGIAATLAGNIGISAWDLDPHLDGVAVVELSSYHGADLIATGEVAVLTLLADDHLDWHGSAAAYRRDKLRVLTAPQADGNPPTVRLMLDDQKVFHALDHLMTRVPATGDHRDRNVALAVAAIRAETALLGVEAPDPETLTERLTDDYPSLPSRFEPVDVVRGVSWIDDALASNPSATAAALERVAPGPVVLICGGHDRNVSLDPVLHELDRWPDGSLAVVWLGDDRDPRNQLLAAHPAVGVDLPTPTMLDAVVVAALVARPGWTVLFSPLAPTERADGVWSDRSRAYREAIAGL